MRICDVDTNYSPTGGGVRTYHDRKVAYYRARPEIAYALVVPSKDAAKEVTGNVTVYRIPGLPLFESGYRFWVTRSGIADVLDDFRPELVEIGAAYALPLLLKPLLEARRVASVGFYHADYPDVYVRAALRRFGDRVAGLGAAAATRHSGLTYGWMTAAFGASRYSVGRLRAAGVRRTFLTPLGFEAGVFSPGHRSDALRERYGARGEKRLVLFSGRLAEEKGIDRLMAAYPRFRDPGRIVLVVEGRGPGAARVQSFTRHFPEVHVIGRLSTRAEVAAHYASADAYLSLGACETFGIATLEAVASGTPVVAVDSGGAGEIIRESGAGVVCAPRDPGALADAVLGALAKPRTHFSEAARVFLSVDRTWRATFDRITPLYERIIAAERDGERDRLES